jgi:hypothetical protein
VPSLEDEGIWRILAKKQKIAGILRKIEDEKPGKTSLL